MDPHNCYKTYIALKNHFTKDQYDYHKYCGKVRASIKSFYNRKDRFWFEKLSRNKSDKEIIEFFVSNFVLCDDPQSLWIGEIIREGESKYKLWNKRLQSLSYIFKEEVESVFQNKSFDNMFLIEGNRHPEILKQYLQNNISLETIIILDRIINFKKIFDKKMSDPVWEFVSKRMDKYSPFLIVDVFKYKKILKECIL